MNRLKREEYGFGRKRTHPIILHTLGKKIVVGIFHIIHPSPLIFIFGTALGTYLLETRIFFCSREENRFTIVAIDHYWYMTIKLCYYTFLLVLTVRGRN